MKRSGFLKSLLTGATALTIPAALIGNKKEEIEQVGFEHLPEDKNKVMNYIIHKAESRGHANHGWLDSHHTFSFAGYRNPERMNFGVLRVLNDDVIQGGTGFGTHQHQNMEIISIPLSGALEHKDSTGRHKVIATGDVQIMSAGKGIYHSEYNSLKDKSTAFLQIWLFPKKDNIEPRYDQKTFSTGDRKNKWQNVVAPNNEKALFINQDAWFHLADLEKGKSLSYTKNNGNNLLYFFVIEGSVKVNNEILNRRDAIGIYDGDLSIEGTSDTSSLLLMELPSIQ